MDTNWTDSIISNFDEAAPQYDKVAYLQQLFANKLADQCSNRLIKHGLWIDLGSGTGLLANALEKLNPYQSVMRIDGSEKMLEQHHRNKATKLFNLNYGLPPLQEPPQLITSNFALHWLDKPAEKLNQWFSILAPEGWLAIAVPVKGSFPEWHNAATKANVKCTAMPFPSHESLINAIKNAKTKVHFLEQFTQEAPHVNSLLKPLIKVGAQTTPHASLTIGEWRRLYKSWVISKNSPSPKLTWLVQILLAQR